jgi:hypothetical protein
MLLGTEATQMSSFMKPYNRKSKTVKRDNLDSHGTGSHSQQTFRVMIIMDLDYQTVHHHAVARK